jgi:hypothetical protein
MQQKLILEISESVNLAFAILSSGYIHQMEGEYFVHLSDATLIEELPTSEDCFVVNVCRVCIPGVG